MESNKLLTPKYISVMENQNAQDISRMVNSTLFNAKEVGFELAHDHPYLQQQTFKMMLQFIEQQAQKQYYDQRNEFTVRLCKELDRVAKELKSL